MITQTWNRIRAAVHRNPLVWAVSGAAVVALMVTAGVLAVVLTSDGDDGAPKPAQETGFAVTPAGDAVPRLAPITVHFENRPTERDGSKILQVEPATEGDYAWINDQTLLFQPKFPGLLRGKAYTLSVGARPEAGLAERFQRTITTEGLLSVESVIPAANDVEVPAGAQILVQFSRSVAPLTLLSARSTAPVVTFEPALPGKGEWLNTSLYRFVPDGIAPNTRYKAHIAAGLTSAADGVLKADFNWEFTTYGPALAKVVPDAGAKFAGLRQPVELTFNQAMERASVQAGFTLRAADGSAVAGSLAWTKSDTVATFTPAQDLKHSTVYTASITKGLTGAAGGATSVGRDVAFTTVGLPGVASTQPVRGEASAGRFGVSIQFSNPMDVDTLLDKISISGIDADTVGSGTYVYEQYLSVNTPLRPSTSYTVTLAAGALDRYGQPLAAYSWSFTTGGLGSSVSLAIPNVIGTYAASAEPILFFHTTNRPSVTFTLYPLTKDEARYLQVRNYIPHKQGTEDFNPSLAPRRIWTDAVQAAANTVALNSTSISGGGTLPIGDYYLTTGGIGFNSEFAFSVVDTGIVLKRSSNQLLAWVIDLDSGKPVAGATVTADGEDIDGAHDRTTDADGTATFAMKQLSDADIFSGKGGVTGGVVRVMSGGRYGVATQQWQQGTSPYQLGIPLEYGSIRKFVGYLYTERPIYRPGEDVSFKGVVRRDDDAQYTVPEADPGLDLIIMDSRGKQILKNAVTLNEFGTFASTFTLPATADTGDYGLQVVWHPRADINFAVAGTSFLVAEFKRPEFEVVIDTVKDSYANGDTIDASAAAAFFFGGAVVGAKADWSVLSTPFGLRVKGYERFSFADTDIYRFDIVRSNVVRDPVRARGSAVTGADGVAKFAVPAALRGDEGAQRFTVSTTVTDTNGQAVANSTTVTVNPGSFYAGISPADYLATAGQPAEVNVVSVDTDGNVVPNKAVVVKVYERTWVTTKEQTPEGARRYRSDPVDKLIDTRSTATNAKGEGSVTVKPAKGGAIRLVAEITDEKGRTARSSTYLWVSSGEFASWYVSNDDTIKLIADKDQYNVGDTAEILVPAPFAGASGLVTVERGKIHTQTTQSFPTNSTRISVPITDRSIPDVFVSVVLYRPPTDADPVPRFKVGYVELKVSTEPRKLNVSIQPDRQQAKPGDKVHYDIRVTDARGKGVKAEVSVAVVDKAVLSLADDRNPDGLGAFWFERGLGVITASSLAVSINRSNDVISEPRQGGKGGGGLDSDRVRQDFRNTAYWQAQLVTGEDGAASVDVTMPDNLTTWRMQVRAISGNALIGEGNNELLSTQPLLLRPALPRFLRVGDQVTLRLLVRNATDKATDVAVTLAAQGIDVPGDTNRKTNVGPGESKTLEWPATVSVEGTASLKFSAKSASGLSDAVVQELPVALDVTPETTATGGVVKGSALFEAIYLPGYALTKQGSLDVSVQPTLTGVLSGELAAFGPPPRSVDESTIDVAARMVATVAVRQAEKSAGTASSRDARIDADLATLVTRQQGDGGWKWCSIGCRESDPYVTGWALFAIGEARKAGRNFDDGALARANGYVLAYINRSVDVKYPADASDKAFMLYAVSAAGLANSELPVMRALLEQYRSQLTNWGRAYLLLGMTEAGQTKSDAQVGQLLNDLATAVIPSANGNHWEDKESGFFGNNATRTTAVVLQALVHADPAHPLIEETVRWLMVARGASSWQAPVNHAQGILALSEFAVGTGELGADYDFNVRLGEKAILSGHFAPADGTKSATTTVPLKEIPVGTTTLLSLVRDFAKPGRLYYTLNLKYWTPAKEVEALNRGIAVSHEYSLLGDEKTRISKAKVGDVVRVRVTVMTPAARNYVVVDDLLPAGLEPIDPNLKTTDPALLAKLNAERAAANRPEGIDYYAPWFGWYYNPFQQATIRDDRLTLRAVNLPKGVYEFVYYARATAPGDFFVPPPHAEESLFPEVFGRSDSARFVVEP